MRLLPLVAAALTALACPADATQRYAIVVGNGSYAHAEPLPNARADAELVAGFLKRAGFHVVERYDVDSLGFEALLRQALFEIEADSEVMFYYAGHGFQIGRRNYIVPVDADLGEPEDIAFETVTLDSLVAILGARSRLQVVVLDSCRDNPFRDARAIAGLSSVPQLTETGFSPMAAPMNTLLSFSTAPGAVALDGDGANSPFTGALVEVAQLRPDLGVTRVLEQVRRRVYAATEGRQIPWESSTLIEYFAFDRAAMTADPGTADAVPGPARTRQLTLIAASRDPGPEGTVALSARLDRRVALGRALIAALDPQGPVAVSPVTAEGRLTVTGPSGLVRDHDGSPLSPDLLATLVWEPRHRQEPARATPADHARTDRFALRLPDGTLREAALTLTPEACDWEAGDHLDPEGVGIVRYANEIRPDAALAACTAAVAREPDNARFHYQLARAHLALTDYPAARTALERAQVLGHTRAWHALGSLAASAAAIEGGRSDGKADEAAFPFWYEGVRRGDPYAFHALGKQLIRFGETEEMRTIGFDLLNRALEVGHSFAMNELGDFFLQENTPHHEPRRAMQYLEASARRGDIYGFHNLGLVWDFGRGGVTPDPAKAADWYRKAALGGHPTAPRRLADLIASGKLGRADPAAALPWYDLALSRGDARAGAEAAWLVATATPPGEDLAGAALRAARTATLRDAAAARDATDLLAQMPEAPLSEASVRLLGELGEDVPGGAFGPAALAALDRVAKAEGVAVPASALDRLLFLARTAWRRSPFRVDLY